MAAYSNMMSEATKYHYERLKDTDSIRLLRLLPAESSREDISISLANARLDQAPDYEALSYTWATADGDASLSCSITCDGHRIVVTKNCEAALRYLRGTGTERTLWIDAICINQADLPERHHQVSIMDKIYRSATRVLIWLGEASWRTDEKTGKSYCSTFLEYLTAMAAEDREWRSQGKTDHQCLTAPMYRDLVTTAYKEILRNEIGPLVKGLWDFKSRSWWNRIWVVQEAGLAQSAVLICGDQTASYKDFYDWYILLQYDCSLEAELLWCALDNFMNHVNIIYDVQKPRVVEKDDYLEDIYDILKYSRLLQATDARDKIYAILSLVDGSRFELPPPDYTKSPAEVFTKITQSLIKQGNSLDVITQASNVENELNVPSWVIDWSAKPRFHHPNTGKDKFYHASGNSEAVFEFAEDDRVLRVKGKIIDSIDHISKLDDPAAYQYPTNSHNAIPVWRESCRVAYSMSQYPTGESVEDVLWRTLIWNFGRDVHYPAPEDLRDAFKEFYKILTSDMDISQMKREMIDKSAGFNISAGSSAAMPFCLTRNGYLASVPWTTSADDQIAVLAGASTPLVLRHVDEDYRLIGACYVHGIMDGEAFSKDPVFLESISLR